MANYNPDKFFSQVTQRLDQQQLQSECSFFVYSDELLKNNAQLIKQKWQKGFSKNSEVYYSLKSNPQPFIIKTLSPHIDGFDVSSFHELNLLKQLNIAGNNITISGPAKTNRILELACQMNVKAIHVDSEEELKAVLQRYQQAPLPKLTLRYSIQQAGGSKLGMNKAKIEQFLKSTTEQSISGFHLYVGRESFDEKTVAHHIQEISNLKKQYADKMKHDFAIYMGAGLPSSGFFQQKSIWQQNQNVDFPVHLEAGRVLSNTCGLYFAKVLAVKQRSHGKKFVIVAGGLQHLAANLSSPKYGTENVFCKNLFKDTTPSETYDVFGALGIRNDRILADVALPKNLSRGDWLCFSPTGSYGFTAGASQFISPDMIREWSFSENNLKEISAPLQKMYALSF